MNQPPLPRFHFFPFLPPGTPPPGPARPRPPPPPPPVAYIAGLAFDLLGYAPSPSRTPLLPCFRTSERVFTFPVCHIFAYKPVRRFQRFVYWGKTSCRTPSYFDRTSFQLNTARLCRSQ